jgi:ketosteroid isomerase-like protein
MGAEDNIKTIQLFYGAFGRGDIATIVANETEDVDWATEASGTEAPWYGPDRGPSGVQDFFMAFGSTMEVQGFEPITYAGTDDEVHSLVRFAAKIRETGKQVSAAAAPLLPLPRREGQLLPGDRGHGASRRRLPEVASPM